MLLGSQWRTVRDDTLSFCEWRRLCQDLVDKLCDTWKLPGLRRPLGRPVVAEGQRQPSVLDYAALVEAPFSELPHDSDSSWQRGPQCFKFILDSRSVAQVLNGQAVLKDDAYGPLFERMGANTAKLLGKGLLPPRPWDDPFEWGPRCFNVRDDAVCNLVLDTDTDFAYLSSDVEAIMRMRPHFFIYSYGGCRGQEVTAISWVIYAVVAAADRWQLIDMAVQYRRLSGDMSSFRAEAPAVEAASEMCCNIVCKYGVLGR